MVKTSLYQLLVNEKYVTNFLEKSTIFNNFFSQKLQPISNDSIFPLDPNKAHGHDGISVKMLKLSCPSIIKPLLVTFRKCLKSGTFPDNWKKGTVVRVYKKDNK